MGAVERWSNIDALGNRWPEAGQIPLRDRFWQLTLNEIAVTTEKYMNLDLAVTVTRFAAGVGLGKIGPK